MRKDSRSLEELLSLQDRAIQALQQANKALELALSALEKARNEVGYVQPMFFPPSTQSIPSSIPSAIPYWAVPNTIPNSGLSTPWQGGTMYLSNANVNGPQVTLTNAINEVKSMIQ